MKFVDTIERENTITIDGYSNRKTVTAAIKEFGKWIAKNINETEGNAIAEYPEEAEIAPCDNDSYFFQIEEVPCAARIADNGEMEYSEVNFYMVCRIVK